VDKHSTNTWSAGICSGKKTVAQYLVDHHGFKHLHLELPASPPPKTLSEDSASSDSDSAAAAPEKKAQVLPTRTKITSLTAVPDPKHTFATADDLLDFVTKRWRSRWVTTSVHNEAILDLLARRPFFILISVDAPVTVRHQRYQAQPHRGGSEKFPLQEFVAQSDAHLYDPYAGLQPLISRATVRLLNTSSSLAHLYATLGKLDLANPDRLRPGWDGYFMSLASLAAQRSNCMKRRVGCVLVGKERRVVSTGYNGTPRGIRNCAEGGCPRCNEGNSSGVGLATCLCLHAEENALLEAGRERIREGSVLYCDTCPCLTCSIKICQVGINEVVYAYGYSMDKETAEIFREAGVKLRQFIPVSTLWRGVVDCCADICWIASEWTYSLGEDGVAWRTWLLRPWQVGYIIGVWYQYKWL